MSDYYILDIDSGDRNTNTYPNVSNLEIYLENEIYDVSKIELTAGNINTPQLTICGTNKSFQVDETIVTLDEKNYTDGTVLAQDLQTKLSATTNIHTVSFNSNTETLTFTGNTNFEFKFHSGHNGYAINNDQTTPHEVLGFSATDLSSSTNTLESGFINLRGPNALLIRLSSASDILSKDIYYNNPYYTGTIQLGKRQNRTKFIGGNDLVEHCFNTGIQKTLQSLRIEFFYSSAGKLIPYDFRNSNYTLKLKIKCSKEKVLPKLSRDISLPPPISIPEFDDVDRWENYKVYFAISIIVLVGMFALIMSKPKSTL